MPVIYLRRVTPPRIVSFAALLVVMVAIVTTSLPLPQQIAVTVGTALLLTAVASVLIRKFWRVHRR